MSSLGTPSSPAAFPNFICFTAASTSLSSGAGSVLVSGVLVTGISLSGFAKRSCPYSFHRPRTCSGSVSVFHRPTHILFLNFLTFRDHLHIFVGQSSPSFTDTVCFQSCQLSFHMCGIFSDVWEPSPPRPPFLLFPCTTMSIIFLERFSSSFLLTCPYQCNLFCLAFFGIFFWFLIWSFRVLIHRSIIISATWHDAIKQIMLSSLFLTAQQSAPYVIVGLIKVV